MKEVCIDARMALHSGIGTYIRNILPYLKGFYPSLRVLAPLSLIERWPELGAYDLIPLKAPLYSIQEQLELPFKIPSCDLYWSPHYNIPLGPIRAKKRVVTIHDVYHLAYGHTLSFLKRYYAKVMINQAARRSDHIFTVSNFSKNEILTWTQVPEDKVSVIHLGVNRAQFVERVDDRYDLPEKYILFVSSLAPHKNISRLLRAWRAVHSLHPDWKLVLVGKAVRDTSYLQVFNEFPALRSEVLFLNEVSEQRLPMIYQGAKGVVFPSLYEGFGLPPLEAMAMGRPVIVSNAASLPEVCQEAALYVDPLDEKDIALKLCQLIENPELRQRLIKNGLERVRNFTWEKSVQEHLKIIERFF